MNSVIAKARLALNIVVSLCALCSPAAGEAQVTDAEALVGLSVPQGRASIQTPSAKTLEALGSPTVPPGTTSKLLLGLKPEATRQLRGTKSVQLYKLAAPAVVLVATDTGLGSGTLLNSSGLILTNWHVIAGAKKVGVIFKPSQEGKAPSPADLRMAEVVRVDEVADLALLRVATVPSGVKPIALGDAAAVAIGADVHAIGHPTGESWTYTMGVISQVRQDYTWTGGGQVNHKATVIQTQTPINPGNSGGPLLTDEGTLIGINSFKAQGEGLNFAVGLEDVQRFLASTGSRKAERAPEAKAAGNQSPACEPKELYSGKRDKEGYEVLGMDFDCDGKVDVEFRLPFKKEDPLTAVVDRNHDGRIDMIIMSAARDMAKWNLSLLDEDYDGKWDLVGFHDDGGIQPTRFEAYSAWQLRTSGSKKRAKK